MGNVVMSGSVSVDGFVADLKDQPGPLFDWLSGGDVPLDDSGFLKVSQTSYDYIRPYWDQIGATIVGRTPENRPRFDSSAHTETTIGAGTWYLALTRASRARCSAGSKTRVGNGVDFAAMASVTR